MIFIATSGQTATSSSPLLSTHFPSKNSIAGSSAWDLKICCFLTRSTPIGSAAIIIRSNIRFLRFFLSLKCSRNPFINTGCRRIILHCQEQNVRFQKQKKPRFIPGLYSNLAVRYFHTSVSKHYRPR